LPVGLFDMLKGLVPVLVFAPRASSSQLFGLVCGLMAVVGHVYSVFVRFKGGKGVATAAGVMLALTPLALGASFAVWIIVVGPTGSFPLASTISAPAFPPAGGPLDPPEQPVILWLDITLAAAIIWFHRANIARLLKGTENRFGRRGAPAGTR